MIKNTIKRFNYYKEQFGVSIERRIQNEKYYDGSVFKNCSIKIEEYDCIYFYLDYYQLMHLGDQLFFKPLFTQMKSLGFPVIARPTSGLKFMFGNKRNNIVHCKNTLFISTVFLRSHLKKRFGPSIDYFLFDTTSLSIKKPITNYIIEVFADNFSLTKKLKPVSSRDFLDFPLGENKPLLEKDGEYIILNNYIDSGSYRIFPKDRKLLLETLLRDKKEYKVVHIGSEKDRLKDKKDYTEFVDIDLRGKTSIKDLFDIFSSNRIIRLYTHDTFVLHISNIFNHPASIVFRHFFKYGANNQKRIAYQSLYKKDNSMLTILN